MHVSALYFTENVNVQSLLFGLVILLIIRWLMTLPKCNYNLPPGPIAFPIIGNLLQMVSVTDFYLMLKDLQKQYGDIFRLKIGPYTFVFVCKTEMILEGLVKKGDQLKGRSSVYIIDKLFQNRGIIFSSGKEWKDQRKFAMSALRDLGVGKRGMEEKIYLETQKLSEIFQSHNGKPFSLHKPMSFYTMSVIYNIIFGKRIKFGEPEYEEIIEHFQLLFKHISIFAPENFFPLFRFFRWNSPVEKVIKKQAKIRSYIRKKIAEHKETFNPENIRDFIDFYLLSLEKEPNSETLTEASLFQTVVDIFLAGTDTTATHLTWAFLYMAKYTDIQEKCRKEILQITNQNRPVTMEDKPHMTYVAATLLEVHRIATIAALSAPHTAEVHTTLGGYDIPKDTLVAFLLMEAHSDPNYWDNPQQFRPERWIGENNELKKNEAFVPFGSGPRMCAGVSLANREAFLAFTNILQKFQLEKPDETPIILEGIMAGLNYAPMNTNIRAVPL
ncbi:cytochrome P450 2B4 [Octopus bimaculoides]|uniref:cytochrome P450 2B4 n=1 Tax=Octopus bimaculoides TaxID=37653 RepID=UPI00071C89D9|nr:cytochrome P450 2B4 [Octopus bimaculoides]|eukprot:XP_014772154.1 PREDICTED: cytochrome P450 2B4-like [Octopus bimaculoides]